MLEVESFQRGEQDDTATLNLRSGAQWLPSTFRWPKQVI